MAALNSSACLLSLGDLALNMPRALAELSCTGSMDFADFSFWSIIFFWSNTPLGLLCGVFLHKQNQSARKQRLHPHQMLATYDTVGSSVSKRNPWSSKPAVVEGIISSISASVGSSNLELFVFVIRFVAAQWAVMLTQNTYDTSCRKNFFSRIPFY
jgi:hypothetical protein